MDTNAIVSIISSIGFPIVMCGAMGWFIKYIMDRHTEETKDLRDVIAENTKILEGLRQLIADHLTNK